MNSAKSQDINKINVQKSVAFLCTNTEAAEREIKESIPFITAPKTMITRHKPNQRGIRSAC